MSLFKIVNLTGEDQTLDWLSGTFTYPSGIPIDIVSGGSYIVNDEPITYRSFSDVDDITGMHGGDYFDGLKGLLDSGAWKLQHISRTDRYCTYDEALWLLLHGDLRGFTLAGESLTIVSHDICQPCTWYQKSIEVQDEVLTADGDTYSSSHKNWLNLTNGYLYQEDSISVNKAMSVKINGGVVASGKYTMDYEAGSLKFNSSDVVVEGDVVTASYWYGKSSAWDLETDPKYLYRIIKTELQLDSLVVISSPIIMEIIIDHPLAGNDYVVKQWKYKSVRDLLSGSNLGFTVPSFGGTKNDSGYTGEIIILPFNYTQPMELPVGVNARVRFRMEGDEKPSGHYGTVTFYMDRLKL